jgi:hypothetical protein
MVEIEDCSFSELKQAVVSWHYSGSIPFGKMARYKIVEDGRWIGAVMYAPGANYRIGDPFGLTQNQCWELVRVALDAHTAPVTQILSMTRKRLKVDRPDLEMLISYADPNHGHTGVIYRADNWVYLGRTAQGKAWRGEDGRIYHNRHISKTGERMQFGRMSKTVSRAFVTPIKLLGKHKYALPLNKKSRKILKPIQVNFNRQVVEREID